MVSACLGKIHKQSTLLEHFEFDASHMMDEASISPPSSPDLDLN